MFFPPPCRFCSFPGRPFSLSTARTPPLSLSESSTLPSSVVALSLSVSTLCQGFDRLIFLARPGLTSTGLAWPCLFHGIYELHGLDHGRDRFSPLCHDPQQEASSQQLSRQKRRRMMGKKNQKKKNNKSREHDSWVIIIFLALFLGIARPILSHAFHSFLLPALFSCRTQDEQKSNGTAAGMGRTAVQEAYHAKNERKRERVRREEGRRQHGGQSAPEDKDVKLSIHVSSSAAVLRWTPQELRTCAKKGKTCPILSSAEWTTEYIRSTDNCRTISTFECRFHTAVVYILAAEYGDTTSLSHVGRH